MSSRRASKSASSIGPPGFADAQRRTVTAQSGRASTNAATAASSVATPRAAASAASPFVHSRRSKASRPVGNGAKALPSNQSRTTASFRFMTGGYEQDLIAWPARTIYRRGAGPARDDAKGNRTRGTDAIARPERLDVGGSPSGAGRGGTRQKAVPRSQRGL